MMHHITIEIDFDDAQTLARMFTVGTHALDVAVDLLRKRSDTVTQPPLERTRRDTRDGYVVRVIRARADSPPKEQP